MQVNEFRIGNKLHFNGKHKEVGTVTAISKGEVARLDMVYLNNRIDKYYNISDIKPIPITEEWMTNFGFHPSTEDLRFIHETLDVEIEKQGNYFAVVIWNEECPAISNFILHSQYVHEFQNNIFAITQTELTIK